MTPEEALALLLDRICSRAGLPGLVSEEELGNWSEAAVAALRAQGLISKAAPAQSVVCPGCERECAMPVHLPASTTKIAAGFVVCDKRSDTNRVLIPPAKFRQWQCRVEDVCRFVATNLGIRQAAQPDARDGLWPVGLATGAKRSQMLCLRVTESVEVVVGASALRLAELIGFDGTAYAIDRAVIRQLVDASTTADSRYTPSTAGRDTRKAKTQARYAAWQKMYRDLVVAHPNMSDVWYSQKIAKSAIAEGRDAETIRKHMKP